MSERDQIVRFGRFMEKHLGDPCNTTIKLFIDSVEKGEHMPTPEPVAPKGKFETFVRKLTLARQALFIMAFMNLSLIASAVKERSVGWFVIGVFGGYMWFDQALKEWKKK